MRCHALRLPQFAINFDYWLLIVNKPFAHACAEYIEPKIEVISETSAVLTSNSNWKMNKAAGVITKELSVLQKGGSAKLSEGDFQAL